MKVFVFFSEFCDLAFYQRLSIPWSVQSSIETNYEQRLNEKSCRQSGSTLEASSDQSYKTFYASRIVI